MGLENLELLEQQHLENQEVLIKILEMVSGIPTPVVNVAAPIVNIPAPIVNLPAPIVNIEENKVILNQNKVVDAVEGLAEKLINGIKLTLPAVIEKPLSQWNVDVLRNSEGNIVSMNFKQIK